MLTTMANGGSLTCTNALQDIPNLSFSLSAGATYRFFTSFQYQATVANTSTIKPSMGGTCVPSFASYRMFMQLNVGGGTNTFADFALSNGSRQASSAVQVASTNLVVAMDGLIVVQNAGTLTAQCMYGTAGISVQAGGVFTLEQIA